MQEEDPVHYDAQRGIWDVFRYEDATRVLTDETTFSADIVSADTPRPVTDDDLSLIKSAMIRVDGDVHDQRRDFATTSFSPRGVDTLQPRIKEIADDLLTSLAGRDRVELLEEFSTQLPRAVTAELFDIPQEDREKFKELDIVNFTQVSSPDQEFLQIHQMVSEYFSELIAERADGEGDDLITLAATQEALSQEEKIGFCLALLIAGMATTNNLIAGAIRLFVNNNLINALQAGRIDREKAIEEVLRYRSPVQSATRRVTRPVELGGKQIKEGQPITVWIGAANRDPEVFTAPDEFRPERTPNPHMAFGRGEHFCLGSSLARLEGNVAIQTLLDRFDRIAPEESDTLPRHVLPQMIFS
ncbi:cytochrome P450 [Natrialba taiwanensis]|uniref:Cytochrome P450 n=1 Tax=Natrialba taiwanensis DSM 12281 TaxID=1230458 RepID=L9ZMZ9_9EURY|nr:cytochrome P450 [Natrialba taiwanensis]ELY86503.1 cytochrome P450 [Natrialba taiwanensis DSM 12281]